jgi:hypothetical protein
MVVLRLTANYCHFLCNIIQSSFEVFKTNPFHDVILGFVKAEQKSSPSSLRQRACSSLACNLKIVCQLNLGNLKMMTLACLILFHFLNVSLDFFCHFHLLASGFSTV